MAFRNWHWGKMLILWLFVPIASSALILGVAVVLLSLQDPIGLIAPETADMLIPWLAFPLGVAPFIAMLVLTWKWLGGKERDSGQI